MHRLRNILVLLTFLLTTVDFFQQLVLFTQTWVIAGYSVFQLPVLAVAILCGAFMAHLVMSLWNGTSLHKDIADYEPEPVLCD